jgi:hypothetical protein
MSLSVAHCAIWRRIIDGGEPAIPWKDVQDLLVHGLGGTFRELADGSVRLSLPAQVQGIQMLGSPGMRQSIVRRFGRPTCMTESHHLQVRTFLTTYGAKPWQLGC